MNDDSPKEPMIGQQNRPSPIDFDAPIADFKLKDLMTVVHGQFLEKEQLKEHSKPEKEHFKEQFKELSKPEKEILKGDRFKELSKPEKEFLKGDSIKEFGKPEKELKAEKEIPGLDDVTIDRIAERVADVIKQRGGG